MKKLMIAAAIVCAAVISQGAQFTWKTAKSNNVNPISGMTASTAYLFENTDGAAAAVLAAFAAGNDWTAGKLDSTSISADGKITQTTTPFTYGGAGQAATINAFFAFTEKIDGKDYMYISTVGTQTADAVGDQPISFSEKGVSTAIKDANTYAGAGWYTAAAVPEPTSGLLLLLGVAGLALKRRRA